MSNSPTNSGPASPAAAPTVVRAQTLEVVTGVQLMQGIGVAEPKGFWEDAWSQVCKRPGAVLGMIWIGIIAFFAVFSPLLANGHPWVFTAKAEIGPDAGKVVTTYPLLEFLTIGDWMLIAFGVASVIILLAPMKVHRSARLRLLMFVGIQSAITAGLFALWGDGLVTALRAKPAPNATPAEVGELARSVRPLIGAATIFALSVAVVMAIVPLISGLLSRLSLATAVAVVAGACCVLGATKGKEDFSLYAGAVASGNAKNADVLYTLLPRSPGQQQLRLANSPPMTLAREKFLQDAAVSRRQAAAATDDSDRVRLERLATSLTAAAETPDASQRFALGTNARGQDVLSQMMHACRLSISIGLVSTSIAVLIGITLGALMGYFGGWVDLLLMRVVEIFMSIPVLFLLIVAAAVLPQNIYVMMVVIGCVTWTGAARFTRAEFLKLRNQDFVQAAKSAGLPLSSILFRHMLPNGVTAVLVDATFSIAAAIQIEAVLSFLALSPPEQPSWGRLLSDATSGGTFQWWLAFFPGMAIFLTVLAYNLIGEALRDAIDPKLKKARV